MLAPTPNLPVLALSCSTISVVCPVLGDRQGGGGGGWLSYPADAELMPSFQFNSIQFNFICIALNHSYSGKGFKRLYFYDIPLTLAPPEDKKETPLISRGEILRRNAEWGIPPSRNDQECNRGHY